MPKSVKVVQFTDTHLYKDSSFRLRGVDTYDTLKRTADQVIEKGEKPDLILLTGDISMDETAQSYDRVREILEPMGVPIYFLPGNHDCVETMQTRFIHHNQNSNIRPDRTLILDNWLIVLLNSVIPMKVEGLLEEEELNRLDHELGNNASKHALVCLHHNVIPFAVDPETDVGLNNKAEFLRVIDKHKNVRGVLWGHVHSEHFFLRNGVPLMASPSTCIQFRPVDNGVAVEPLPPGYRVLILNEDGSIDTRVEWLPMLPDGLMIGTGVE